MQTSAPRPRKSVSLRLATGECIVVTLESWRKFLGRLQNNYLTNESPGTHTAPQSEGNGTNAIFQTQ
jgi:hypothetical protein